MAAAVPLIPTLIGAGASIGGSLLAKRAANKAGQPSPLEQQATTGQQAVAQQALGQAGEMNRIGLPATGAAANYFGTLLRGNRAAMSQAVAGPTAQITDLYRGAERGLERSNLRGGARDQATAELNRQRASQLAGLTTGVQPMAANALGDLGLRATGQAGSAIGTAGNLFGDLTRTGMINRQYANQQSQQAGGTWGRVLFDTLAGAAQGGRKARGGGAPAIATTMPVGAGVPATGIGTALPGWPRP